MRKNIQGWGSFVGILACVAAVTACGSSGTDTSTAGANTRAVKRVPVPESSFKPVDIEATIGNLITEIGKKEAKTFQFAIHVKDNSAYWQPVTVGANRAMGELGVTGGVSFPTSTDTTLTPGEQQAKMQSQIDEGTYQGFGIAPLTDLLNPTIDAAVAKDMPVITFDGDAATTKRQIYVGTPNQQAGETGGKTTLQYLAGKKGTVLLLGTANAGWVDGLARTNGAKSVLEAAGLTVVVRESTWSDQPSDITYLTEQVKTATPPVVGCLGVFGNSWGCAKAVVDAGKTADDVTVVAFDVTPDTVTYMRSGIIKATHAQRQYYMGYMVPYVLYGFKVLGVEETKAILAPQMTSSTVYSTGLDVVPAEKLDEYNNYLDGLGIGGTG